MPVSYPYPATTIRGTQLIILGGDNVNVPAATPITVHGEVGAFGTVSLTLAGTPHAGAMLRADYI